MEEENKEVVNAPKEEETTEAVVPEVSEMNKEEVVSSSFGALTTSLFSSSI